MSVSAVKLSEILSEVQTKTMCSAQHQLRDVSLTKVKVRRNGSNRSASAESFLSKFAYWMNRRFKSISERM